jgi:hypothetical protein
MALNQQQVNQQQPIIPGNDDAANLARQIQANTNVNMKTEVVILPDFYGDLPKDTIMALKFMAHIDDCQVTNEWNDIMNIFVLPARTPRPSRQMAQLRHPSSSTNAGTENMDSHQTKF